MLTRDATNFNAYSLRTSMSIIRRRRKWFKHSFIMLFKWYHPYSCHISL